MAYAIILDEYLREGLTLTAALTRLVKWSTGVAHLREEREAEMIAAQNRETLRWFEGLMGVPRSQQLA